MTERKLPPGIRKHHGRFQARYYGPDGRERTKSFTRLTDAKKFKAAMTTDKDRGKWTDPRAAQTPFDDWAETWLSSRHKQGDAKKSSNGSILARHVIGDRKHGFGSRPLGSITPLAVQEWVNHMVGTGYQPSYIRSAYTLLAGVLRGAAAARLIPEAPVVGVELPSVKRKRERFLSERQIDALVAKVDPFYRPLVFTAFWTGCRWSELAALARADLDLTKGDLSVNRALTLEKADDRMHQVIKPYPESDAGKRTIGLPESVVGVLRAHLEPRSDDLVFTGRRGWLLLSPNFRNRHWNPAVTAAGLEPLSFHDARHTHVALLIRYGWQAADIQARLGWSTIRMVDTYRHLFPGHDRERVIDLERHLQDARTGAEVIALGS
jgi:integrase